MTLKTKSRDGVMTRAASKSNCCLNFNRRCYRYASEKTGAL